MKVDVYRIHTTRTMTVEVEPAVVLPERLRHNAQDA